MGALVLGVSKRGTNATCQGHPAAGGESVDGRVAAAVGAVARATTFSHTKRHVIVIV